MARLPKAIGMTRKADVLRAATGLFAQRGFHGTSMSAVAEAAGLQKASLYHWVTSKEDLLFQVLSGALDHLITETSTVANDETLDFEAKLRRLVSIHSNFAVTNDDVMQVFRSEAKWLTGQPAREMRGVRRRYLEVYEDLFIAAAAKGGLIVPAAEIPVYVNLIFTMTSYLPQWYRRDGAYSLNEVADLISGLVLAKVLPRRD